MKSSPGCTTRDTRRGAHSRDEGRHGGALAFSKSLKGGGVTEEPSWVLKALRLKSRQRKWASIGRREGRTRRFIHCRIRLAAVPATRCDHCEVGAEGAQQLREPRPGIASKE